LAEIVRSDADLSKRQFQVAGYTDSKPLAGGPFKDNWGLSAMRARSVLVLLHHPARQGRRGLPPSNWSAAGFGDTGPVASNDTEEGPQQEPPRRARRPARRRGDAEPEEPGEVIRLDHEPKGCGDRLSGPTRSFW
jgi:outer membrane protein OmpA-like peptidoglycan-associated protein